MILQYLFFRVTVTMVTVENPVKQW